MWCVAELDGDYIERMEDVLGVYERPYDPAEPVVCLDEKPVPLHADVRAPMPAKPGTEARRDNEYKRCGTANVFGVVEPKAGRHFTTATPDRSAFQFAQVIYHLALEYPEAKTIHLVMDNLNTHRRKSLTDLYGAAVGDEIWDRFTIHYTPKHGSWLDQAEIELSLFSRQCLGSRRIPDLSTLQRETKTWNRQANRERTTINWRFTRRKARKTFHYQAPRRRRSP
jgi:DDE superfamily endonuclease